MTRTPKVSISIPSYNHAGFLAAAIESVLTQTYQNIELIIVDDGSTDGSLQIAEDYAARHPSRIKVFTHPNHQNRGISATVNLGWEKSTGEYWSGLPSDDMLYPNKVEEQVAFMETHPEIGWVYCYAHFVNGDGRRRPEWGLFGTDITRAPSPLERLIEGNVIPGMTALMRRSFVERIAPHDETLIYSDWDFWVRLVAHAPVAFLPRALVKYRVHSYNTSVGNLQQEELDLDRSVEVLRKLRRQADDIGGGLALPRVQALLDLQLAFIIYLMQDTAQAAEHLAAAFATDPTLSTDTRYFTRWLKARYRQIILHLPERLTRPSFPEWTLEHLPAGVGAAFVAELSKNVSAWSFSPASVKYHQAGISLKAKWKIVKFLLRDARNWRGADPVRMNVEMLAGSLMRKRMQAIFRSENPRGDCSNS
ncbi:MAG TPA: glycosyltransferase [Pyrinomonadaceae bacterium]|nr:glycosyltransferase [Pyrinomonadaceae bacterium]